ncbi:PIN domain-containing protein [Pseudoduganella sp. FT55W]|uniref:Ribonuclease VapC n=1 Tax=Duganella rivi TaxID=2666083 RepID=A0A7X4GMI9_9BURK|nr:type II toxin-antitoxin system VapC family toxin [Duganella rivi]MYM66176.1 PIN domain-containing protein [Duganella rivi]
MAQFMLDTNICIYLMKDQPPEIAARFDKCYVGDVVISAITFAELEYGVLTSANPLAQRRNLANMIQSIPVASFDAGAAIAYGPVRQATRTRKRDQLDKLIAAHAIALGITLVTNNVKDFADYPGIEIENWLEAPPA